MNRLDRLYALVEELRAAGAPGCSARRLAERFEVSVRTVERDILARRRRACRSRRSSAGAAATCSTAQ
jgi:predicted DNA-binding transcriptional regulator YafY